MAIPIANNVPKRKIDAISVKPDCALTFSGLNLEGLDLNSDCSFSSKLTTSP